MKKLLALALIAAPAPASAWFAPDRYSGLPFWAEAPGPMPQWFAWTANWASGSCIPNPNGSGSNQVGLGGSCAVDVVILDATSSRCRNRGCALADYAQKGGPLGLTVVRRGSRCRAIWQPLGTHDLRAVDRDRTIRLY
jgi:hypothetical protein